MKTRAKKRRTTKASAAKSRSVKTTPKKTRGAARRRTSQDIKKLARRWFDELWNRRNGSALVELMHPSAVGDTEGGTVAGHDEFYQKLHSPLLGAFPDLRVTVDDVLADGNDAAVRWTLNATHSGDTLGMPASNRRVSVSGITWLRYRDGLVVKGWDRYNASGLMAYLKDGSSCATVREAPLVQPV